MSARDPHPATLGPRPRGRPTSLSRRAVGEAARAVGFRAITLTAVAERLGVSHTALYSYVCDRDDLVMAAAEAVVDELSPTAATDDWRELLEGEAWVVWDAATAHPGMLTAVEATGRTPEGIRARFATTCHRLVELGFDLDDAMTCADAVYDLAADSSTRGSSLGERPAEERAAMARQWAASLPPPLVTALTGAFSGDGRDWFARKLALVLDGVSLRAPPAPTVQDPTTTMSET